MWRTVKLTSLLLVLGMSISAASGQTSAPRRSPTHEEALARSTGVIGKDQRGVLDALVFGLTVARVPGGVVTIMDCGGYNPQVSVPPNSSVKALLDQMVLTSPQYHWSVDDGVINLIPETTEPVPLGLRISSFKVENVSASEALNKLLEEPEVQQGIESLNLRQGGRALGGGFPISKNRISLDMKNVTLQEALNAIVRADGLALWAYTLRPCSGHNEYDISLLIS